MKKLTCLSFAIIMVFGSFAIAQNSTIKRTERQIQTETVQVKKQVSKDLNFEKVSLEKVSDANIIDQKSENTISNSNNIPDTNIIPDSNNIPDTIHRQTENIIEKPVFLKGCEFTYEPDTNYTLRGTRAAPANDAITNATTLPINGTCLDNETNVDSGTDYYGGCIPNGTTTVFYRFILTGSNDMITITLKDFTEYSKPLYFMLIRGPLNNLTALQVFCTTTPANSSGTIEHSFYNLTAGTTYYLLIGSQPGVGNQFTNYDICGQQKITPTLITGPEQDCFGALPVCDISYSQTHSYTGVGAYDELVNYHTCILGGESNSVWYVFTPQTSGTFFFTIETLMDYDWALYNLTTIGGCVNISSADPIRCNWSGTNGNTGLVSPAANELPALSNNDVQSPFMPGVNVTAGNTYALLVNNYSSDANGYSITFSGTASIADNPDADPPTGAYPSMSSAAASCTSNAVNITMSELIVCLSISNAGFTLTNTTTSADFTSAMTTFNGQNCASSELTSTLIIGHNGSLTTGQYELKVNTASTISDKCGNLLQIGGTVSFNYLAPLSLTANETNICSGESINLDANGADGITTYTLNPGGLTNTTDGKFNGLTPAITSTYTVSATYGGCTRTATETVNVEGNIIVNVDPAAKTVCDFDEPVTLTASTSINGTPCVGCIHTWSTTETTDIINVNAAGTYTVTAVTASGCASSNTASSTITLASSGTGGGSCDVIYVSPSGSGDGYTKEAPTSLADAVAKARCTNTDIKMMVGVYTLTNFQVVPSYITIDGGYNSDFTTKSSDMSGGTNSTTIRRSSSADAGYPTDCSAFRVEDAAEDFRIQNLRIEMPGSTNVPGHTAASGLVSYGIKLGTGCTNYNIVRCYIDAGVGAAP